MMKNRWRIFRDILQLLFTVKRRSGILSSQRVRREPAQMMFELSSLHKEKRKHLQKHRTQKMLNEDAGTLRSSAAAVSQEQRQLLDGSHTKIEHASKRKEPEAERIPSIPETAALGWVRTRRQNTRVNERCRRQNA